jgi:HEPN domain-containing protein
MAVHEEIQEWLDKAEEDRRVAEILLCSGEELTLPCMFHLQQMLEKLLKALIIARGKRVDRTHDLDRLAQQAEALEIEGLLNLCDTLNLFAVNGRYPGDLPEVSIREARTYSTLAEDIGEQLVQLIVG